MIPFNAYVTYVRINRAKYLLKNYRQSLDEVATACGFSDASYFCRVFRRLTRLTPSGYRGLAQSSRG
jgi:transcriptional regulator GlxA family with amidase domain